MISDRTFAEGMAMLAEAYPQRKVTRQTLDVYRRALRALDDAEFERAVDTALTAGGEFFPSTGALLRYARPASRDGEIAELFEAVERSARYVALRGLVWDDREIGERFGSAAREAFIAAGGSHAFQRLDEGDNRVHALRRFTECYRACERDNRLDELIGLPPSDRRIAAIIGGTAKVLQFPGPKKSLPPPRSA